MISYALLQNAKLTASAAAAAAAAIRCHLLSPLFPFFAENRRHAATTAMAGAAPPSDPAAIVAQKRALRTRVRSSLRALPLSQKSQEDAAIQEIVLNSPWFKSSSRLCAYISCHSLREVDTSTIVSSILSPPAGGSQGMKKLYVPRVEDKNSHMRMLHISRLDDLVANSMKILEPSLVGDDGNQREDVMLANDPVDLFLLPGLAFDRSGHRLGRGGGYYDTLVRRYQVLCTEKQWKRPLLVALAYSAQILDEGVIPVDLHDIPVDALISSSGVIPISAAAAYLQSSN